MKYIKTYETYPDKNNNGRIKKGSYVKLKLVYDEKYLTKDKPYKVLAVNKGGDIKIYNDKEEIDVISRGFYEKVNRKDIKFLLAMNKYNL